MILHERIAYHRDRAAAERRAAATALRSGSRWAHQKLALQHEVARYCVHRSDHEIDRCTLGANLRTAFPADQPIIVAAVVGVLVADDPFPARIGNA